MPYPSSSKNIISSSEVVYPFKKRLFGVPEDFSKPKCTSDENSNVVRPQSAEVVPDSTSSNDFHDAARPVDMEIASIELALELARSSVTILPINCRGCSAEFHLDRFISGTRGPCILYKNQFYTPYRFVLETGCDTDIEWSIAIKFNGFYIKSLIDADVLRVHEDDCVCRKCRNLTHDFDVVSVNTEFQNNSHSSQPMDLTRQDSNEPIDYTNMADRENFEQKYKIEEDLELGQQRQEHPPRSYAMRDDAVRDNMASAYAGPSTASYRTREEQQYAAYVAGHSYATREARRVISNPYGNTGPSTAASRGHEEQQYAAAQAGHLHAMHRYRESSMADTYDHVGPSNLPYCNREERREVCQYAVIGQEHPRPGGSNMNIPYGNPTATCTNTSTSDLVCVYDVRVQRERETQLDKLQKHQRGGKRPALAVVENSPKRQRYDTPKEQPNTGQQVVDVRRRTIVEPTPSTSRKPMPNQNTEQQNWRDQDLAHYFGSTHTHLPYGRQNGLRLDQSCIRHGRDREPRIAPLVVPPPTSLLNVSMPRPANIEALNIVGIIPESRHYLVRHADNSVHNQSVIIPENIRALPIGNVTPEIYVTPANDDMPPSPGAIEQVIGECMEIDDEVD